MTTLPLTNSIHRSPLRIDFLLVALTLTVFALTPPARAQLPSPTPDGGYLNQNTAEGSGALSSVTTGANNTAVGFDALFSITDASEDTATGSLALANDTGGFNTAYGFSALNANTTGQFNTATGRNAMLSNTTGINNTATGGAALASNTTGENNTATGRVALESNTTGFDNTAEGFAALFSNTTGSDNTATGALALSANTTGSNNTAFGQATLFSNTTGRQNTAVGFFALLNSTGSNNIALGPNAGINLTTGSHNIDIGNRGVEGESNTLRIGAKQTATFIAGIRGVTVAGGVGVIVGTNGQLGTRTSSERFKDQIKPMDKASEAILALKPVTFRYKKELDPDGIPQFGLVAEQVERVNPALVARDEKGQVYTVRYEAVNAMLLNEFLKEHRKVEEQQNEIDALKAELKEQRASIQRVSDKVEMNRRAAQMVLNDEREN
jgi:hypothetical protein